MVWKAIRRALEVRELRNLLAVYYEGEARDKLVGELYPLLNRIGYGGLEHVIRVCSQLDRYSGRTAVTLLEESPALIERLLTYGDKDLVVNVYGLCSQVYGEGTAIRLLGQSPALIDRVGYNGLEKIAGLCSQVAREDAFVATKLLGITPALLDRVGYDGLERIAGLSRQVATDRRFIAALLEMTPELIDRVGIDVLEKVVGLCCQVAGYSGITAVRLLGMSPTLIDLAGIDVLERVVGLCCQVAQEDSFVAVRLLEMSPTLIDLVSYDCLVQMAALCRRVNRDDGFIAAKVLDECPDLIARIRQYGDNELVTNVYGFCHQVAADYSWRAAVRLLGMSPDLIARLQRYGDNAFVMNVYGLCSQVARYSGRAAVCLLEESPDLLGRVGYDGLEKVAYRASEIVKREGEEKAASFVRGEASEYASFFDSITEGLELKKVKPILSKYLSALLGYRVEIVEAEGATTDGERIFLPGRVNEFDEEERNFTLYKVLATHEEAHLEYGSFDFELMKVQDVASAVETKYATALRNYGEQ